MMKSRPEGVRWVLNGVSEKTILTVRELSVHHDVYFGEVIDQAVEKLYDALYDEGYLPKGWKEY